MELEFREARRSARRLLEVTRGKAPYQRSRKVLALERKRIREKVKESRALRRALEDALDSMRSHFFALSGLGAFVREADDDAEQGRVHNSAHILGAVDAALTPDIISAPLKKAMQRAYRLGLTSARDELAQVVSGTDWNVPQTRALAAIDSYIMKFAKEIIDREKAALKALIRDSIENGTSTQDLAKAISDYFEDGIHYVGANGEIERTYPSDAWAEMVGRTETTRAYNAGNLDLYRAAEVENVMWLTAEDERVCDDCADLDGEVAKTGEEFSGGVDAPPLHPSCRCTLVIADEGEGEE